MTLREKFPDVLRVWHLVLWFLVLGSRIVPYLPTNNPSRLGNPHCVCSYLALPLYYNKVGVGSKVGVAKQKFLQSPAMEQRSRVLSRPHPGFPSTVAIVLLVCIICHSRKKNTKACCALVIKIYLLWCLTSLGCCPWFPPPSLWGSEAITTGSDRSWQTFPSAKLSTQ